VRTRLLAGAFLLAAAGLAGGCIERTLVVDSVPAGAHVFVNGKDRGTTPVSIPYTHEGRFEIRLEKEGYESRAEEIETRSRIDAIPGPDLVLENMPGPNRRVVRETFEMTRLKASSYTTAEMDAFLAQAQAFRAKAAGSFTEEGTPTATRPPRPAAPPSSAPVRRPKPTQVPTDALAPGGDLAPPGR